MRKVFWLFMTVWSFQLRAQSGKVLPRNINPVDYNSVYPAVSGDGKVMLFMSDYTDSGDFGMMLSKYRAGKWQNPVDNEVLGSSKVNNWGGYSLNYDGTAIYFSSRRSNGVGGFDVWYSTLKNNTWSRPANIGKPLNSKGHEGNPSITPDNQRIYFMRCDKMSTSMAKGCKIYYSDRGPRGWGEAVALPDYVNKGNTTSPRILPDNRTLVFASDRPGGKGGMDIWLTKRNGEHWSEPINVSAVNSAQDDYFMSASLRSLAYYTTVSKKGKKAIAELRLPNEFRLQNVIIKQGAVRDEGGSSLAADVRAYNLNEQAYESRVRTSGTDGKFILILPEGAAYDVSYNEIRLTKLYKSELVDATDLVAPRREYPNIVLQEMAEGAAFPLNVFGFNPFTAEIDKDLSHQELGRLARLLNYYTQLNIRIEAYQKTYLEDSVPGSEDLTEVRQDTIVIYKPAIRVDTMANHQKDSLLSIINQQLSLAVSEDVAMANEYLARMSTLDSVAVYRVVNVYHNNRSQAQAEAVKEYLQAEGINTDRLEAIGYRNDEPPVAFPRNQERMIVIRFLNEPSK